MTGSTIASDTLTVTGTSLPTTDDTEVWLGRRNCTITAKTATEITCTLDGNMLAGDWKVIVRDANGQVPNGAGVTAEATVPVITTLTPNTDVPPLGGGVLQIDGKHFPKNSQELSYWANNDITVSVGGVDCPV